MEYPAFFLTCFDRLIGHEGKFTKNPKDPGNWTGGRVGVGVLKGTKYGISAASYPHLNIEALTLEEAKDIYYLDWWLKFGADYLHDSMIYQMWQFAVNAGGGNARRCLQRAASTPERPLAVDGKVGERTIAAVRAMELCDLMMRFNGQCIRHYVSLETFGPHEGFGRGWMLRVAGNLDYAAVDN
jgi:lysozyme family protein